MNTSFTNTMGCFLRWLIGIICCFSFLFSAMGYVGMQIVNSETEENINCAIKAAEKRLEEALAQNGPAWVKGRIEIASGTEPLTCGNQICIWKRTERFENIPEDIKAAGSWTTQFTVRKVKDEKAGVPFDFIAGSAKLHFDDWLGIIPAADLLQVREDMSFASETENLNELATAALKPKIREQFLLPGQEVWLLGMFKDGKIHGYVEDSVYLTGLGPQRFISFLEGKRPHPKLRWIFLAGILVPSMYFAYLILKRRS